MEQGWEGTSSWPWSISGPPCPSLSLFPKAKRSAPLLPPSSSPFFLFVLRPGPRALAAGTPGQGHRSRPHGHLLTRHRGSIPHGRALPQQHPAPLLHRGKCWGEGPVSITPVAAPLPSSPHCHHHSSFPWVFSSPSPSAGCQQTPLPAHGHPAAPRVPAEAADGEPGVPQAAQQDVTAGIPCKSQHSILLCAYKMHVLIATQPLRPSEQAPLH